MRKVIIIFSLFMLVSLSFGAHDVGDSCDNISWIDSDNLETSIYDQINQDKAVMMFFGRFG